MHNNDRVALRERVKELECLYALSRVLRDGEAGLEEVLKGASEIVPRGFQYPESAGARVRLGGLSFQSGPFQEGRYLLSAAIPPDGIVEVSYPEEIGRRDPLPFLPEEQRLLKKVAAEVSLAAGRITAAAEKARLESQLRHADRLATIGVLATGVAHELNEPLASVLGFAQLLQKNPGLPRQASHDLARIVEACLRAREIVQKLLAFGRNAPARVERCDLNRIVEDGLRFLEPRARREGIELVRDLAPGLPLLSADPTQINQVLVNLVVNSMQAMPAGGRITIGSSRASRCVRLTVSDEGIGMSPQTIDRIFVPFFTTKGTRGGTGLGLPVVHGIVSSLGGDIAVQSELGKGSRFEVDFPLEVPSTDSDRGGGVAGGTDGGDAGRRDTGGGDAGRRDTGGGTSGVAGGADPREAAP